MFDPVQFSVMLVIIGVAQWLLIKWVRWTPIPTSREVKIVCPTCKLDGQQLGRPLDGSEASEMKYYVNRFARMIHIQNKKWWCDILTGKPITRNKSEMVLLMHSELSEVTEAIRRPGMKDKHLPHRLAEEVELADTVIRILDYADGHGLDIGGAMVEKLEFNRSRADHQREERLKPEGKKI